MKLVGNCHLCGKPAMQTCSSCGLVTCANCNNKETGICFGCQAPVMDNEDFDDDGDDY